MCPEVAEDPGLHRLIGVAPGQDATFQALGEPLKEEGKRK